MSNGGRMFGSEYMHWAKSYSQAKFNLATSGYRNLKFNELQISPDSLEITTEYGYGYSPLKNALAQRLQVAPDALVTAAGTSFANHLAMAAVVNPGDEVVMELPTYEPLLSLAHFLGARVKRFKRRFENEFKIDLSELEPSITDRTRLIALTNLHNPSGVLLPQETIKEIGQLARKVNSRVLIDEVYLESMFEQRPLTAFHFGPEFIVTGSLTKAFGLSGLRCGWIVAEPELAQRMWLLNDLFSSTPVHVGERLSVMALHQLDHISDEVRDVLKTNRRLINEFLDSRDDLECVRPEFGTIIFPRLRNGNADEFCERLREKYETSVVPGRFFEMRAHFRIGLGGNTQILQSGLERIGLALDEGREGVATE